jgi:hypothetical protein
MLFYADLQCAGLPNSLVLVSCYPSNAIIPFNPLKIQRTQHFRLTSHSPFSSIRSTHALCQPTYGEIHPHFFHLYLYTNESTSYQKRQRKLKVICFLFFMTDYVYFHLYTQFMFDTAQKREA